MRLSTSLRRDFYERGWVVVSPEQLAQLKFPLSPNVLAEARIQAASQIGRPYGEEIEPYFNFCSLGKTQELRDANQAGLMSHHEAIEGLFNTVLQEQTDSIDRLIKSIFERQIENWIGRNTALATGQLLMARPGQPISPWGIRWHVGVVLRLLHRMLRAREMANETGSSFARSIALLPMPYFVLSAHLPLTDMSEPESGELLVREGSHHLVRRYLLSERTTITTRLVSIYDGEDLLRGSIDTAREIYREIEELLGQNSSCYPVREILCPPGSLILFSPYLFSSYRTLSIQRGMLSVILSYRFWADTAPKPKR